MTSAVITDMLALITCEEHMAPTRRHVEQRCLALDPLNPLVSGLDIVGEGGADANVDVGNVVWTHVTRLNVTYLGSM